ncbi:hypothetical protein BGX27_011059 [Mortierella sp. AM989]|nr:hypothetical protein BGX27_011059 [Mortierella sp. AM989]
MSDTIAKDATPHPRNGVSPHQSASDLQDSQSQHIHQNQDTSDDSDDNNIEKISRPHSRQSNSNNNNNSNKKSREGASSGFRPSVFGHSLNNSGSSDIKGKNKHSKNSKSRDASDSDSELSYDDNDDDDNDDDDVDGAGNNGRDSHKKRRRRKRLSASHLLAKAPPVPDLRFDTNYRKALDQIYETHAAESAHAAELNSISVPKTSTASLTKRRQRKVTTVPSITARITVMTLRDIIIMPFIHGFFWGFGTILLSLAGQRTLVYHVQKTWRRIFGDNTDNAPFVARGEPARVRINGLMNTRTRMGQPSSFGNPTRPAF